MSSVEVCSFLFICVVVLLSMLIWGGVRLVIKSVRVKRDDHRNLAVVADGK